MKIFLRADLGAAHGNADLYEVNERVDLVNVITQFKEGVRAGDDLKPALKRAIEQVKQGKSALIGTIADRRNHG